MVLCKIAQCQCQSQPWQNNIAYARSTNVKQGSPHSRSARDNQSEHDRDIPSKVCFSQLLTRRFFPGYFCETRPTKYNYVFKDKVELRTNQAWPSKTKITNVIPKNSLNDNFVFSESNWKIMLVKDQQTRFMFTVNSCYNGLYRDQNLVPIIEKFHSS